jgi:hypothetical protein
MTGSETHTVELTGNLTNKGGPLTTGPCLVHTELTVYNVGGVAHGDVNSLTITTGGGCVGKILGTECPITAATSSFEEGPWTVTATTAEENVTIHGANFTNTYGAGCSPFIPNGGQAGASGEATGTFNNETGCVDFNESGDLENPGGTPIKFTGSLCGAAGTIHLT